MAAKPSKNIIQMTKSANIATSDIKHILRGSINIASIDINSESYNDFVSEVSNSTFGSGSNCKFDFSDLTIKYVPGYDNLLSVGGPYFEHLKQLCDIYVFLENGSLISSAGEINTGIYCKCADVLDISNLLVTSSNGIYHYKFSNSSNKFYTQSLPKIRTLLASDEVKVIAKPIFDSGSYVLLHIFFKFRNYDNIDFIEDQKIYATSGNFMTYNTDVGSFVNGLESSGLGSSATLFENLIYKNAKYVAAPFSGVSPKPEYQLSKVLNMFPNASEIVVYVNGREKGSLHNIPRTLSKIKIQTQSAAIDKTNDADDGTQITTSYNSDTINKLNASSVRSIAIGSLYTNWDRVVNKGYQVSVLDLIADISTSGNAPLDKIAYLYPNLRTLIAGKLYNTTGGSQVYFQNILNYLPKLKSLTLLESTPATGGAITSFPALEKAFIRSTQTIQNTYTNFISNVSVQPSLKELIIMGNNRTSTYTDTPLDAQQIFNKFPNLKAFGMPIIKLNRSNIDEISKVIINNYALHNISFASVSVNNNIEALGVNWSSADLYTANKLTTLASKFPNLKILRIFYNGTNTGLTLKDLKSLSNLEQLYIVSTKSSSGGMSFTQISSALPNLKVLYVDNESYFPITAGFNFAVYMPKLKYFITNKPKNYANNSERISNLTAGCLEIMNYDGKCDILV